MNTTVLLKHAAVVQHDVCSWESLYNEPRICLEACCSQDAQGPACLHVSALALQQGKLKEHDVLESIILAERAILYTLAFQIKIELPQTCLFKNLESVGVYTFTPKDSAPQSNLNAEQQQRLSQIAVNFANDR